MTLSLANMSSRAKQLTAIVALIGVLYGGWAWFDNHYAKAAMQRQILGLVQDIQKNQMKIQLREDDREYREKMEAIEYRYGVDPNKMPPDVRKMYRSYEEQRKNIAKEQDKLR